MTSYPAPEQFAADHTAQALRQHGTGAHHRDTAHQGNPKDRQANLAAAQAAFDASNAAYAISTLTRALMKNAPDAAAATIAEIAISLEKGYAPETAYAQATADGMDAEALIQDGHEAAQN